MSRQLDSLIAQAAEMRAAGYTWSAVGKKVNRRARTCQRWPRLHPFEWEFHYQAARQARFEQIAHEADTHLNTLMRSDDPKVQLKAVELSLWFAAGAYSGLSTVSMGATYRVNQAADEVVENARFRF